MYARIGESFEHTVTIDEETISAFAHLICDLNPLHHDRLAVKGIVLSEAELEEEDGVVVYELEGMADGKTYEIEVTAEGKVLEVEQKVD